MKIDQTQPIPAVDHCTVKVMRSYDYCHFEVVLGSTQFSDANGNFKYLTSGQVDALRKEAARLADKAVEQYKIARLAAEVRDSSKWERDRYSKMRAEILALPEGERSPEQMAIVKKANDDAYWASRGHYDYEDDYDPDQGEEPEA